MITKHIQVLDDYGYPIEGVNITFGTDGTTTDQNGKATVSGFFFGNEWVTLSHIAHKNQTFLFAQLPGVIYLESEAIQGEEIIITASPKPVPVVIQDKPKTNWFNYLVGGISILAFINSIQDKKDKPLKVKL